MSIIEQLRSNKLPCYTSLFITIDYNKELFDILIQDNECVYDEKLKKFEFPINKLKYLVEILIQYGSVKFIPYRYTIESSIRVDKDSYKPKLYSHQIEGIQYGLNHNSWLLLDDQGLGKTIQMICLAESLKQRDNIEHCLIICGVSSLKYNWAEEIEKFSKLDYIILGQQVTKTGKIKIASVSDRLNQLKNKINEFFVITNVETLRNKDFIKAFNSSKNKFGMIVFDEIHHCKSPTAQATKTLLKLKSSHNIALTGTIILNNPEDCYIPLKWTDNVKCTFSNFKKLYNIYGGFGGVQVIGNKNLLLLNDLLSKCALRRLKSQVLDLPERVFLTEYVDLTKSQRELYDEVADGIAEELDKLGEISIIQELSINMRLRQITAFPGMLSTSVLESAKLDRLEDLVNQIVSQGDKVAVFSNFKGTVPEVMRRLSKYNPVSCTGDNTDTEISNNKNIFNTNNDCKVIVSTWQKMGTGHTLTAANYVIFIDTPYTMADFMQVSDRIYRIGQNKSCTVITLIAKDTYDERVKEILETKDNLTKEILDREVKN